MKRAERRVQVLSLLSLKDPPTRREIADSLGVSHQYVTNIVNELAAEGRFVRRIGQPRTTRAVRANAKAEPHTL